MTTSVKFLIFGALTSLAIFLTPMPVVTNTASAQDVKSVGPVIQYHNPEGMPRWTNSYAVSYEPWLKAIPLDRIFPSDKSDNLPAQLRSSFKQLDKDLAKNGFSNLDILKINVMYKGDSFENTLDVSNAMREYFEQRIRRTPESQTLIDYPIGSVLGIEGFKNRKVLVALDVTLTDVHKRSSEEFMIPEKRLAKLRAAGNTRSVMIGGVTAMQDNFMVKGYGDIKSETMAAMENFLRVVKSAGGNAKNIDALTVYYHSEGWKAADSYKSARVVASLSEDLVLPPADLTRQKTLGHAIGDFFRSAGAPQPQEINFVPVVYACGIQQLQLLVEGTAKVSS